MSGELKLDSEMLSAYQAYLAEGAEQDPDRAITVIVRFEDDPHALADAGFSVATVMADEVIGTVRYADLERLSKHPNAVWIMAGAPKRPTLDTAVEDVHARAHAVADIGVANGGLWHAEVATGAFVATGGASGSGVIVAVIDTGIDVSHPMFHKSIAPYDTRILRIWDMGLAPIAGESRPAAALTLSGLRYGVEYQTAAINTALNSSGFPASPLNFRHRDCVGHGTHLASTAAGGPTFSAGADASRVGVAPRADIIAVKFIDNPDVIRDSNGNEVSSAVLFRDAVIYCLRVARSLSKPIVINCSFVSTGLPGDGLDSDSVWLDRTFDPAAAPPDGEHFPTGAVLVNSAGNDGRTSARAHATITIPDSGQIVVPFELFEDRGANKAAFQNCGWSTYVPEMRVHCWFRRVSEPNNNISVEARVPTEATFSEPIFAGFRSKSFDGGKVREITQVNEPAVQRPTAAGGTVAVRRNNVRLYVEPSTRTSPPQYALGIYDLRFVGPPGTTIHAMCDQGGTDFGGFGFKLADAYADGTALPAAQTIGGTPGVVPIDVTPVSTIVDGCARRTLTVASYDDNDGNKNAAPYEHPAEFSSRGPLRDFSDPPLGPLSDKPNISAPGVAIWAALSKDSESALAQLKVAGFLGGDRFVGFQGTSMSAPMIAGVVALMLEKKNDLSAVDAIDFMTDAANVRPGTHPRAGETADDAYGAGMVDALKSHAGTH